MRRNIKFESNNEIKEFEEYSDKKIAIAKVCVLSTAKNSHEFDISEEVLKRDIGSIKGNFLVADVKYKDNMTHTPTEVPVGYFLPNKPIEFEEVETQKGKIVKAWAYAALSKQYAKEAYEMFVNDNHRATSIEMTVELADDEHTVLSFDAYGSTILGRAVQPSCKDAEISLIRFAEEANAIFDDKDSLSVLKQFAEQRRIEMEDNKNYVSHPIDTSKKALYSGDWNGQKAKQDLVKEKNFITLAPKVCLKLEDGWRNREVTKCGYPVMMLHDGKWVYSKEGISSALAYAKQHNETGVISKLNQIRKKLGIEDSKGKEADTKMAEIAFAAVDIGDMWGKMWDALHAKYPDDNWGSVYRIDGIYEEDNKKFAIIHHRNEDTRYRLDFSLTEEGITLADEIVKVKLEVIETDEVKKFAEPENANKYKKFEDRGCDEGEDDDDDKSDDDKDVEMSADEMKAEMAKMKSEIEDRDNIIMQKDAELEELRKFKAEIEEKEKLACVDKLMSEVKNCMSEDKYNEFREEGVKCSKEELAGWENKVKAFCFETVQKTSKVDTKFMAFAGPIEIQRNEPKNVWDRIKQRNNFN